MTCLLATACVSAPLEDIEQSEADLSASPLVLGAANGAKSTRTIAVSGKLRRVTPETYNWSCGRPNPGWHGSPSNFAWVEIKNTNTQTAVVSVDVSGPGRRELFAYPSSSPTSLFDCTTFSTTGVLTNNNSVVVEANQSMFLLVATGDVTAAYTVSASVDALVPAATKNVTNLTLATSTGVPAAVSLAVSGVVRRVTPETYNWSCGRPNPGWYGSPSNFAWVEIKNTNTQTAVVSVDVSGPGRRELFAYPSSSPTSLFDCTTFSTTGVLTNNNSVVVEANESIFLLVATGDVTGAYTVSASVDALVDP